MRTFFFFIFFILIICSLSLIAVNNLTGNMVNTPNCPAGHTYAFYRTLEERKAVEAMWLKSGFVPTSSEEPPDSFKADGTPRFLCLRRMTTQELNQLTMRSRDSVLTKGSSI